MIDFLELFRDEVFHYPRSVESLFLIVNLTTARKLYPLAREAGITLRILDSRLRPEKAGK